MWTSTMLLLLLYKYGWQLAMQEEACNASATHFASATGQQHTFPFQCLQHACSAKMIPKQHCASAG